MKKSMKILLITAIFIFCFAIPGLAENKAGVFGFYGSVPNEFCLTATNKLSSILLDLGCFELVERGEIERLLQRQHLQDTGLIDEAVQVGKILSIQLGFIGSVDHLFSYWDGKAQRYRAEAGITFKVINIETEQVLHIIVGTGYSSSENKEKSLYQALEACFSGEFVLKLKDIFSLNGIIIKVDGDNLYFFNGKDRGVKQGQRFKVFRAEVENFEEMKITTAFKEEIAQVEVTEVTEGMSKAKILWNSQPVLLGDTVEEIVSPDKKLVNLGVAVTNKYVLEKSGKNEKVKFPLHLTGRYGKELPFRNYNYFDLSLFKGSNVTILGFGVERGLEYPFIKGLLYGTCFGGGGISLGFQEITSGTTSCLGYYIKIGCGGKYYVKYDSGPRINLNIFAEYGPQIGSKWKTSDGTITYAPVQKLDLTGFGLELGVSFPF